jgi:hypothetical protein
MLIPWIYVGDFNKILDPLEKYGGHGRHGVIWNLSKILWNTMSFLSLIVKAQDLRGQMGIKGWTL